jgi:hypothetical protein
VTVKIEDRHHLLKFPFFNKTRCGRKPPVITEERLVKIQSGEIRKCHACWFPKPGS